LHSSLWRPARIVLLLAALGCAEQKAKDEFVAVDQVPTAATDAAAKVFPGFKPEQVWKIEHEGETAYEFRGKTPDGKSHETTISAAGKVLWPIKK
jgi:hypothetical protein